MKAQAKTLEAAIEKASTVKNLVVYIANNGAPTVSSKRHAIQNGHMPWVVYENILNDH